jgi:hypothetical protein
MVSIAKNAVFEKPVKVPLRGIYWGSSRDLEKTASSYKSADFGSELK